MTKPSVAALHEAGHAIAAHVLRSDVSAVVINEDGSGFVRATHKTKLASRICSACGPLAEALCARDAMPSPQASPTTAERLVNGSSGPDGPQYFYVLRNENYADEQGEYVLKRAFDTEGALNNCLLRILPPSPIRGKAQRLIECMRPLQRRVDELNAELDNEKEKQ